MNWVVPGLVPTMFYIPATKRYLGIRWANERKYWSATYLDQFLKVDKGTPLTSASFEKFH